MLLQALRSCKLLKAGLVARHIKPGAKRVLSATNRDFLEAGWPECELKIASFYVEMLDSKIF